MRLAGSPNDGPLWADQARYVLLLPDRRQVRSTTSSISGHIPDLDLITYYSENNRTIFARISPWTKAIMLVVIVLFITLIKSMALLAALYVAVLLVYAVAGLPLRRLFAWYTLPLIFVLSLVL